MREGDLTYDDFLRRIDIQDVLKDAGYHLNRRDGLRYPSYVRLDGDGRRWKSHATLTLLAKQDLPTFGYNMIDPLKSWCWGSILFYPFKISRFS